FHATVDGQKIGDKLAILVEKMAPDLSFPDKSIEVSYVKNYTKSPKVQNAPDGARQKWSSSAPNIATVDNKGNVTLLGVGRTIITVQTESTVQYKMASASYQLNVRRADPLLNNTNKKIVAVWNDGKPYSVTPEFGNADVNRDELLKRITFTSSDE
ncbi:invasin, partial [Xenorhabdus sp. 12]